jgi:hypothetical protein
MWRYFALAAIALLTAWGATRFGSDDVMVAARGGTLTFGLVWSPLAGSVRVLSLASARSNGSLTTDAYDSIIAVAAPTRFTTLTASFTSTIQAHLPEGAALRPEQMSLLESEALKQCDARG